MATKFVKGLITPPSASLSPVQGLCAYFKLLYEFWGFCVNGTSDLANPGGFASVSGTLFPTDFSSGSTLLAVGSDGSTAFGTNLFNSSGVNFSALAPSSSLVGKCLVTWVPNSTSTDDSIYRILGISNGALLVDISNGGSPRLGSKAAFTDRTGINFRIIDIVAASALRGWTNGNYMVLNAQGASTINAGQSTSQFKIELTSSSRPTSAVKVSASPSGSWNGSSFSDGSQAIATQFIEPSTTGVSGSGMYYFMGSRDFLISHFVGIDKAWCDTTAPAATGLYQPGIHFEIPKRLYPQQYDPNPITWTLWSNSGFVNGVSQTTGSYADGFYMVCQDGATRKWTTMVRSIVPSGDSVQFQITPLSGGIWEGFKNSRQNPLEFGLVHFDNFSKRIMTTDATLMQTGSIANPQFCFSRVKLRTLRFTSPNVPLYSRLGGSWIHIGGGVLWPWDDTDKPLPLFSEGGGGT